MPTAAVALISLGSLILTFPARHSCLVTEGASLGPLILSCAVVDFAEIIKPELMKTDPAAELKAPIYGDTQDADVMGAMHYSCGL